MGLLKYIVNLDELASLLAGSIAANAEPSGLRKLLEAYFDELLSRLDHQAAGYEQCSAGLCRHIPALTFDFLLEHTFDNDAYITGVSYSQTGWKSTDCWSLYIGEKLLFDRTYTKELGEYKHFNVFHRVSAGTAARIVHHNNSGNSKQLWFDIEYLQAVR